MNGPPVTLVPHLRSGSRRLHEAMNSFRSSQMDILSSWRNRSALERSKDGTCGASGFLESRDSIDDALVTQQYWHVFGC
jgi:hypothetical protein